MPANDGTTRVWYAVLDMREHEVMYRDLSYEYDHESAASGMEQHKLPREYSETLRTGLWDNSRFYRRNPRARTENCIKSLNIGH